MNQLDTSPREACAQARAAHTRASTDAAAQAETALALAIALNRLGEFREARALAEQAAAFFTSRGASDSAARALCEAAWADTFIGDFQPAIEKVARARAMTPAPLLHARGDWIQARVLREQARYPEVVALLEQARDAFQAAALPLEAARCERELASAYIHGERGDALILLERLQAAFQASGCVLDAAMCAYLRAVGLWQSARAAEALMLLVAARRAFENLPADYFAALCDLESGIVYRHLNRLDESVRASRQARDYFLAHALRGYVAACDINLGNAYYLLNRYDEALTLYQEAAALALADGREARAARIYTNMGLVHARQGAFSKALDLHQRALQIAASKNLGLLAAGSHASLAACYRQLGQYDRALAHLRERERLAQETSGERRAAHQIDFADLHLARGEIAEAVTCLEQARRIAAADGLDSLVAICERLLAQAAAPTVGKEQTLARVEKARALFHKHTQIVDAALCDLTEGELHLGWNQIAAAQTCFQRARAVLAPAFPDQAWRTDYGLGRCALAAGNRALALVHYLRAARTIAAARAAIVTEQLSNDFFARRAAVFDDALSLALQQGATEAALEAIEASKARTFLTLLQAERRDWKARPDGGDPYLADLNAREKTLRYRLRALRERIAVYPPAETGESLRSVEPGAISVAALEELNALSAEYEAVVTQLRLATSGLAGVAAPEPFSLAKFRAAASARLGANWAALDYYLADDALVVVTVTPQSLHAERKHLTDYDRAILNQCVTTEPDARELIYRGTLHGARVPSPGADYLRRLYRLLIPAKLEAETLVVAPHRALHALPFHALQRDDAYLIEQHTLVYAPSLQVAQLGFCAEETAQPVIASVVREAIPDERIGRPEGGFAQTAAQKLGGDRRAGGSPAAGRLPAQHAACAFLPSCMPAGAWISRNDRTRVLGLGLADFGDALPALPHAAAEMAMLREAFGGRGEFLWGAEATRQKLLDLDAAGELRGFDVLHFATHAILDSAAPHQSRVLLADDALTALDILDLTLNARLVTLSACQTALGQGGQGDELLGLARAFFYAGARALLATLWHVEDRSMVELTQRFYRHWTRGENAAAALRQAQIEMLRAGSPPYHWASFVFMGQP